MDDLPVSLLAIVRAVRLVASARLRQAVLTKLVDPDQLDTLAEIEGATSNRLLTQSFGNPRMAPNEMVHGVPFASFINASFAYPRPFGLNRFNGPDRGAWYAAYDVKTSLTEVIFHMNRELENIGEFRTVVEYGELYASFAGKFADLRNIRPVPKCLDPDIEKGYPEGNAVAHRVRADGLNGIIYPSVRDIGGTCIVALIPHAVQSVCQGGIWRVTWKGSRSPEVIPMEAIKE